MTRKYTRWTKELLAPIVANSKTYAECLRKMNLASAGGNYGTIQRLIDKFELDDTHFLGQAHNRGKEIVPFESLKKKETIKQRLIDERGHCCEKCKNEIWLNVPITLELEHIDGNNRNHARENLQLLCPNCHSQTPTWRNRKR